jgi:ABC-type multidrug transport system permease subunit
MELLISIIIAGFATGYVVEFISSVLTFISPKLIKQLLTLPTSFLALWLLGINGAELFVYVPASAFVSLVVMLFAAKPVEVAQVINRR